jgi:hypothetical protein
LIHRSKKFDNKRTFEKKRKFENKRKIEKKKDLKTKENLRREKIENKRNTPVGVSASFVIHFIIARQIAVLVTSTCMIGPSDP